MALNGSGWTRAKDYLATACADAACFQEHWLAAEEARRDAEVAARRAGWALMAPLAKRTAAGGASAGVAIAARSHFGLSHVDHAPTNPSLTSRVAVAWFPGVVRGGVFVISAYFWTAQDITSVSNRAIIEFIAELIDALQGPWVIAADWQREPHELAAAGVPAYLRSDIVAPSLCTCGAKVLDFFLVSSSLSHVVVGAQRIDDVGSRPHFGVRLVLASGGRQRTVMKLKAPRLIRDLPAGPRTNTTFALPPAGDGAATQTNLDLWYSAWINAVEEVMTFGPP